MGNVSAGAQSIPHYYLVCWGTHSLCTPTDQRGIAEPHSFTVSQIRTVTSVISQSKFLFSYIVGVETQSWKCAPLQRLFLRVLPSPMAHYIHQTPSVAADFMAFVFYFTDKKAGQVCHWERTTMITYRATLILWSILKADNKDLELDQRKGPLEQLRYRAGVILGSMLFI